MSRGGPQAVKKFTLIFFIRKYFIYLLVQESNFVPLRPHVNNFILHLYQLSYFLWVSLSLFIYISQYTTISLKQELISYFMSKLHFITLHLLKIISSLNWILEQLNYLNSELSYGVHILYIYIFSSILFYFILFNYIKH